jgi:hypothetical protein
VVVTASQILLNRVSFSETWSYLFFRFKKDYLAGMNILLIYIKNKSIPFVLIASFSALISFGQSIPKIQAEDKYVVFTGVLRKA